VTASAETADNERRTWWERRRFTFSLITAASYALTVLIYESFTPWWAGDHIGLGPQSLVVYTITALIWVAAANVVYGLGRFSEWILKPADASTYRRRTHAAIVALGAASSGIWIGVAVFQAWLRHR
jgi:hypothetical protein